MKNIRYIAGLALVGALLPGAYAQPGPGMGGMGGMGMGPMHQEGMGGMGMGPSARPMMGRCDQSPNPARCEEHHRINQEVRQKAVAACADVPDADRRRCIRDLRIGGQDCQQVKQPERCVALKLAYDRCKDKAGPAMRACMHEVLPPADCSKAVQPARCEIIQKARAACKTKPAGPERHQCMREQPGYKAAPRP